MCQCSQDIVSRINITQSYQIECLFNFYNCLNVPKLSGDSKKNKVFKSCGELIKDYGGDSPGVVLMPPWDSREL